MSKLDGFKAWKKLTAEQQAQAVASVPAYKALLAKHPDRIVKHVQGYLNGRMFESFADENVTELETPERWRLRLDDARKRRQWHCQKWGPMPGRPGCRVPSNLLVDDDGIGWKDESRKAA
eukprot:jgi/Tetstr1/452289/TSEL_039325.t1